MFFVHDKGVFDLDLDLLAELLDAIDRQLDTVTRGWRNAEEADELGYFDRAEHITGFGFVACQAYMTATYGFLKISKLKALSVGPSHRTGHRVVELVNHAANYWKHHDEWPLDKSPGNQNRIKQAFDAVGFPVDVDYPLSGVLTELVAPKPASFAPLVQMLAIWRDALRKNAA